MFSLSLSKLGKIIFVAVLFSTSQLIQAQETVKSTASADKTPLESLVPMMTGLGLILLIIFVLAFILKKFSNLNLSSSQIKVLDCQRLGTKEKLVIVKVQDKHLLLGVTPQSISHITDLKQPDEPRSPSTSFDRLMKQFIGGQGFENEEVESERANNDGAS